MAIEKKWVISQIEVINQVGDLEKVAYRIHYRRQMTETVEDKTYFAETYSVITLPEADPQNFTPYEQLTKEQVEGWLASALNVEAIDASLAAQIEDKKHPKTSAPALPWS